MKGNEKLIEKQSGKPVEVKKIAIVGLPNTGKSHVFNFCTGEYTLVANYPLTTVEIKKTQCKVGDQLYEVIDTPGLHSLYIHSEEEIVVRDLLFSEKPDAIIQCIDANQFKQSLVLTADLLELGIPMVIALNAIKETAKKGIRINSDKLSQILGTPVVELLTMQDQGKEKMSKAIGKAVAAKSNPQYEDKIDKMIAEIESEFPEKLKYKRKKAILLLENDPFILSELKKEIKDEKATSLEEKMNSIKEDFSGDIGRITNKKRHSWVDDIYEKSVKKQKGEQSKFLQDFAHLCRHPVFGVPILLAFIYITFYLVVNVAGFMEGALSGYIVDPTVEFISGYTPEGFWNDFLVGYYGVLTLGFFTAVCTVLPIISVFFLMFGLLEDIGYIPNLCVLTKRILEKIGLSGNSIMSLVLGFGCKTMATLTTRSLKSRKEKFIAVYLIAFCIPCAAQLAIDMGVLGRVGFKAFLIAYGTLVLIEIAAGAILNKILPAEKSGEFIQELPPIRIPNIKALLVKTYYRLYWFLKEALPIFIIAAVVLFAFDKLYILDFTKKMLSPIVGTWLGLPLDILDVLILSLARHEAAAGLLLNMVDAGALNYIQCIVAVVITTMFVPCFANIVAMCKEMGVKTGLAMAIVINISSFILAGILNWVLIFTIGG